jgi:hypothetical protein
VGKHFLDIDRMEIDGRPLNERSETSGLRGIREANDGQSVGGGQPRAVTHRHIAVDKPASDIVFVISTVNILRPMKSLLRLVAPGRRPGIVGCVDGMHRGHARGWAIDLEEPASRLTVRMVAPSGRLIAQGLADHYRADVQKAGYGDGHYGFALPAADAHGIEAARFLCGRLGTELPRPGSRPARGAKIFRHGGYVLCLDRAAAGPVLTGWAVDRHHPDERRVIRLRAEGQPFAVQRATLFRRDSIERGSDGFHGFSLPWPSDRRPQFVDDLASGLQFRIS